MTKPKARKGAREPATAGTRKHQNPPARIMRVPRTEEKRTISLSVAMFPLYPLLGRLSTLFFSGGVWGERVPQCTPGKEGVQGERCRRA